PSLNAEKEALCLFSLAQGLEIFGPRHRNRHLEVLRH
ncbi:unnamed protein product, partial [marine sediment metagenome]